MSEITAAGVGAALQRLARAVDRLEAAATNRRDVEARRRADAVSRVGTEQARLEATADGVVKRLDGAIGRLKTALEG